MVPMQARNMRLRHASTADSRWLAATLGQISREFGSRVDHRPDGRLIVQPPPRTTLPWLDRVAQPFGLPHPQPPSGL